MTYSLFVMEEKRKSEIYNKFEEFKKLTIFQKIYATKQHRTSNTYRHVCLVTKKAIDYAIKKDFDYDYDSLIRGAMLHDFFFYDWRKDKSKKAKHLFSHPKEALENAKEEFDLTDTEVDIIRNHMWPITISKFPMTKEGRLVSRMDKKVSFIEFFSLQQKTLLFDLESSLFDLNNKIEPYKGMHEVLVNLKMKGYHLGVISNLDKKTTDSYLEQYYRNLFEVVVAKTDAELNKTLLINLAIKSFPIHVRRSRVIFISGKSLDYKIAKATKIAFFLAKYSFKNKSFKPIDYSGCHVIDNTIDLLDILEKAK